jgi:hypothetical protein
MDDDLRIEPGISLWKLGIITFTLFCSIAYGSVFLLIIAVYLSFNAFVMEGFWPYLTEDQAREIRRKRIMGEDEDDTSGDTQEQPPEDTDKH